MGFATDISDDEVALGFEIVEHATRGTMVIAPIANGLHAVKLRDVYGVRYAICDENMMMLYEAAPSLFDLRRRFGLGDRRRTG